MSRTSTYLNFDRETEQAFLFYKSVFGTEFTEMGISRFSQIPPSPEMPSLSEADRDLVMHVELPVLGGHLLMGTDAPASMGVGVKAGNNVHIMLEPDTRKETEKLFASLSEGARAVQPLAEMFWGSYYGTCTDHFGTHWMFNCVEKQGS